MYLFERILYRIRMWLRPKPAKNFSLDVNIIRSLEIIAADEQRTPEEIASFLIDEALRGRAAQEDSWVRWQTLTPREQEAAALICLNYTTRQVAAKLHISPETVKTHAEHILLKFDVPDRHALRLILSEWDFSKWDR